MSDYPPVPPYGASYGSQPQTNPSYLPPYPNQYMPQDDGRAAQTHMASNYDTSMSAYGYNNSIPGFSASSIASAPPPLPIYQGWNQDGVPLPSYSTPHNNIQYTGYGANSYHPPQSYSAPPQQTYHQNAQHAAPYDEGELSEGEFDAYRGQNTGGAASANYGSGYYHSNDGTGYMNTAHRAVYPSGQDYSNQPQQYSSRNEYNNYPRESASYSPYAPASLETGQDQRPKGKQSYNPLVERSVNGTPSWTQNNSAPEPTPLPAPPSQIQSLKLSEQLPAMPVSTPPVNGEAFKPSTPVHKPLADEKSPSLTFRSVAESRKKAENAILNLWARDVRYANYLEEGLDETIVGRLFDSLGLSRAAKTVAILEEKTTIDKVNGTSQPVSSAHETGNHSNFESSKADSSRVLIEQNGNRLPLSSAAATPNKPVEPTDKEKNLKMKMEMLRKSREERAQKAAAKTHVTTATSSTIPATGSQPETPNPSNSTAAPVTNSLASSPLPVTQSSAPQRQTSSTEQHIPPPHPQPPSIPGLFLASNSSPAPSTSTQSAMYGASQNNQRKRPVAADFDTPISTMPFKRPFGQSRNDSLVIDVSEEELDSEDEDVAMDLESQADQDSPVQSGRKMSDQRAAAIQNLPPLTNFPSRKPFISPPGSSAASTPPIQPGSKGALGHPHVLQQKETEIEALKKKIAEAEAAKAAKRKAQQISSGAATPQRQALNGTSGDIASKVESSIKIQHMIGITDDKVISDQKRLADTQAAELEKAAELKRNEAESRRLRREKIATDLPRVDAEVEEKQRKLQQLREEMAKIEATIQKDLEDKRRLAEEMERLGQETEDQLQEQKDRLMDLTTGNASISGSPHLPSLPITVSFTEHEQPALPSRPMSSKSPSSPNPVTKPVEPGQEESAQPATNGGINRPPSVENSATLSKTVVSSDGITSDQAMEAALQETIRADADSHEDGEVDMEIDMEDLYAPDPALLAPESSDIAIIQQSSAMPESQAWAGDREASLSQLPNAQQTSTIENDDDDYEPPEATPPEDILESPPFSPASPEYVPDVEEFTCNTLGHPVQENHSVGENDSGRQVNGSVPRLIEGDIKSSNKIQSFTPYESPLKHFKAFRFHPNFKQEVAGGLRSMTYSNKIDSNVEFCPWELAGGVCNDKSCEFQHFRDIALPEDTILSTLGSPEEFPADQQQSFREGLRQVLTSLRARKVRDFDTIAAEVVAHRSKFLGDPSKVLMLEGTTI